MITSVSGIPKTRVKVSVNGRRVPVKDAAMPTTTQRMLDAVAGLADVVKRPARRVADARKASDANEAISQKMMHPPSPAAIEAGRTASAKVAAAAQQITAINEANRKFWEAK